MNYMEASFLGVDLREGAKILVAYDGSTYAIRALEESIDLVKRFNGSIVGLHVPWEQSDDQSRWMLLDAEKQLKKAGVRYSLRSERSHNAPEKILQIAREGGFDCIAMGSRGVGGAKAWLLGSVSSKVAAEAHCTVLIAK